MKYLLISFLFLFEAGIAFSQEKIDSSDVFIATNFDNCTYGLKNRKGEWVLEPKYDNIRYCYYNKNYVIIYKNGLQGAADLKGNIFIPIEYDEVDYFENSFRKYYGEPKLYDEYFILTKNYFKGLYSVSKNKLLLKIQYKNIYQYNCYLVIKNDKEKYGLADTNGVLISPKYDDIEVFSKDVIKVKLNEENQTFFGVVNKKNKKILPIVYSKIDCVTRKNKTIFIAENTIIDQIIVKVFTDKGQLKHQFNNPTNLDPYEFSANGTVKFYSNDSVYIMNIDTRIIYRGKKDIVRHINLKTYESKVSYILIKDSLNYLIGTNGEQLAKQGYQSLELIKYGCRYYYSELCLIGCIAKKNGKYGMISTSDSLILPFHYDAIYNSLEKLYLVKDNKVSVLDIENLLPTYFDRPTFQNLSIISESLVNDEGDFEYDNYTSGLVISEGTSGTLILPPLYTINLNEDKTKLYFSSKEHTNGYLDDKGIVHYNNKQNYSNVIPLIDNRYIVESLEGLLGLTDSNFNVLLEPKFNRISDVIDGDKIWVALNEEVCDTCPDEEITENYEPLYGESKYLLYNIDGQLLNKTSFNNPSDFINQRAIVSRNGLLTILDEHGKELMPYEYNNIILHDSIYIFLRKYEHWSIFDWNLKPVFKDTFKSITPIFNHSIIFKDSNNILGYQNLNGNTIKNCIEYFNRINSNIFDSINLNDVKSHFYWSTDENSDFDIENFYLLDTIQNLHFKNLIKNDMASIILENLLFESGNYQKSENNDIDFHYPLNDDRSWDDFVGEYNEYNTNNVDIRYIDNSIVSYQTLYSSCYSPPRGMGHCDLQYNFYNYQFMNDSLHELRLGELFINGYQTDLKKAFIKAYEELERNSSDCKNINEILNPSSTYFIIDDEGLTLYTQYQLMDIDMLDDFEVFIPYAELTSIISPNSVLKRFLK